MTIVEAKPPVSNLRPGDIVHGYRLTRPLGSGGFGEVWMAERLARPDAFVAEEWGAADSAVALKFARGVDAKAMEALCREARLMGRLTLAMRGLAPSERPQIVALEESLLEQDPPALAMEFAPGGNLRDWMAARGEKLGPVLACRVVRDIASALAFAHGQGVAHRDLSPENVLRAVGRSNPDSAGWKVADFGLGRSLALGGEEGVRSIVRSIESTGSGDGRVAGKLPYMAPEILAGRAACFASDLYSLGVIWSQLLLGRMDVGLSANWASRVPADVAPLLERCLEYDPEHRWPAAGALVEAIDEWLIEGAARRATSEAILDDATPRLPRPVPFASAYIPDEETPAQTSGKVVDFLSSAYNGGRKRKRPGPARSAAEPAKREESESSLLPILLIAFFVLALVALAMAVAKSTPFIAASSNSAAPATPAPPAPAPRGEQKAIPSVSVTGSRFSTSGRAAPAKPAPAIPRDAPAGVESSQAWWRRFGSTAGGAPLAFHGVSSWKVLELAFAADGNGLLAVSEDGLLRRIDLTTGELIESAIDMGTVSRLEFAPEPGLYVAAGESRGIEAWPLPGGPRNGEYVKSGLPGFVDIALVSGGRRAFAVGGAISVALVEVGTPCHAVEWLDLPYAGGKLVCVAATESGEKMAAGDSLGRVHIWLPKRRDALPEADAADDIAGAEEEDAGSPALGDDSPPALEFRLSLPAPADGHCPLTDLAFTSWGDCLLAARENGIVSVIDAYTWMAIGELRGHQAAATRCKPLPDGKRAATVGADGVAILWDLRRCSPLAALSHRDVPLETLAVSADGAFLATGDARGNVAVWDLAAIEP